METTLGREKAGNHDDDDNTGHLTSTTPPDEVDIFSFGDIDLDAAEKTEDEKKKSDRRSNWDKHRRGRRRGRKGRKRGRKGKKNGSSEQTTPFVPTTTLKPTEEVRDRGLNT